ncbi:MAG: baseplate J/gp47 family protein [Defluviitaleaceae bacterium]|nr:baseplate J/gp47 family protein [Defluviitaleaceae bacterium]MCL2261695.1 baseplate J/gp47 family protein [Defluviitaleaceae bacterium]
MHQSLIDFKNDVLMRIRPFESDRDFAELVTALISVLNDLSPARQDYMVVLRRMFDRLNAPRADNGLPVLDTRPTSEAYDTLAPSAMAIADLATLVEILRSQVFVYTATGENLDDLGRDYDFPRFQATQARRRGRTYNNRMELADFPIASRLLAPETGSPALAFLIEETAGGEVIFICETVGTVGNQFFGDLIGVNVNGLGRALITDDGGAYIPGQDRETDEQYRRRFLQFLRRHAFGGNVAQYQQEVQKIDGVHDLMIFPVWRGGGNSKISIVGANNEPVSVDFIKIVNDLVDPITRSGSGFGFAPIGHRVTVSTPENRTITVKVPVILRVGTTIGQIETRALEIVELYFAEMRQNVLTEWENTYYRGAQNIRNNFVQLGDDISALNDFMLDNQSAFTGDISEAYDRMLAVLEWFPAKKIRQEHDWQTILYPQVIGTLIAGAGIVSGVVFDGIEIDGSADPQGLIINQSQEKQELPVLIGFELVQS